MMYFLAMPRSVHRLQADSTAALHLSSRRRRTPPCSGWERKDTTYLPFVYLWWCTFDVLNLWSSLTWKNYTLYVWIFRVTSERIISTQLCRCYEMLGIQEAVVASGIPEDAKEELKVSLVLERHLNLLPFIIIKFIFYNHKCALSIGPSSVFKIVKMIDLWKVAN